MLWITVRTAVRALWANGVRTVLAMLGIIIGIAAVIAMLAMGSGAERQIMARFEALGTNLLFVRSVSKNVNGVSVGRPSLEPADAWAVLDVPGVAAVSPEALNRVQIVNRDKNLSVQTLGVSAPFFQMRHLEMAEGRGFTDGETEGLARVVVLGAGVAGVLFGDASPVGATVKLNNVNFLVIGVLKPMGDQGFADPDQQAMLPYTTSMKILGNVNQTGIWLFDVVVADGHSIEAVVGQPTGTGGGGAMRPTLHKVPPPVESITGVLRQRHRLRDLSVADDFVIQNNAKLVADSAASAWVFRVLLGTIASISLLVGGIGIMNIMLVTITERTREIGIRKAIGAKQASILAQFLIEAVIVAGLGGLLGAALGIGTSGVIGIFASMPGSKLPPPLLHGWYILLAVAISTGVGIFFGVYPAWRASRLDPIESLRYE
jgi:putative ABC transport system permease protein